MKRNTILILLLIVSTIIILLNNFLLKDIPECFEFGAETGFVLSKLALAYIASYIFYQVVVVTKERKDKRNLKSALKIYLNKLIAFGYSVYDEVIEASASNAEDFDKKTITREDFDGLCNIANPGAIPPNKYLGNIANIGNMPQKNYSQFLHFSTVTKVGFYVEKIFNYMPFLESDLVALINELINTQWFAEYAYIMTVGANHNPTMMQFSNNMYDYLECIRKLDDYYNAKLAA